MSDAAWEISHSVETPASPAFVWSYMTNVANWDDPPAEFQLDGPFAEGSRGTTLIPGQAPTQWILREVRAGESYTMEFVLDGAAMLFEWRFAPLTGAGTKLTQKIVLKGKNAPAYLEHVRPAFTASIAPGMNKIAAAIGRAAEGAR